MTISVVLVDDQELLRAGLRLILEGADDIEVVGEAGDGDDALSVVVQHSPDLVLMDIRMPRVDGIEATRRVLAHCPKTRVLILTTYDLDEHLYEAIRAGACGFILKTTPTQQLLDTVRAASAGDTVLAPPIVRRLLDRFVTAGEPHEGTDPRLNELTEREREVLGHIARGATNDEIAEQLYVSEATVKSHVNSLFRKLQVRDRVQAVIVAYESGVVRPGKSNQQP